MHTYLDLDVDVKRTQLSEAYLGNEPPHFGTLLSGIKALIKVVRNK